MLSAVFCCNENGVCRGVVDCIRIYDAEEDILIDLSVCDGRPPTYRVLGSDHIKIGRAHVFCRGLKTFGGSWNADECRLSSHESAALLNRLDRTKWTCEVGRASLFIKWKRGQVFQASDLELFPTTSPEE